MNNSSIRIGIDCRLWNETGVGRYIRNLVAEVAKLDTKNEYILFFRKDEFETVPLPGKNFQKRLADIRWHTFEEQTKFANILQKERLHLVHFPYFSYPILYTKKFVITIHDLIINHFPTGAASTLPSFLYWVKHLAYRFILSKAIHHATKIIAVSKATKQEVLEHYRINAEKVAVTAEGIDPAITKGRMEKVDIKKPYVLYVGNAYPHKNLERLITGFKEAQLKLKEPVYLIFVGKEDYFYKKLKDLVKREGLETSILFYQHISDEQLAYLYTHAVALVAPSVMEGFGLPALEAMEQNCLVLASEIPAFLEVCGSAAVYFDPFNKDDIAKTLIQAFQHDIPEILAKKAEGEKRAKQFSWREMARQTIEIYESSTRIR